jgi:hypothetical protein
LFFTLQVKSVFIDGLPPYWDEDRVKDRFKAYGLIERVVLARNMSSAKRNDFGFVNFSTHEAALACIEATNNTELGDEGKSKVFSDLEYCRLSCCIYNSLHQTACSHVLVLMLK